MVRGGDGLADATAEPKERKLMLFGFDGDTASCPC